ncbi:MAG: Cys-tRNA(Pro) deacylase [Propionibacteriaceae bacterium]|jgi:Cys-tRNA(Pro)/Cys-tRNA(Cys) deacylase|nr:Cys-tRNA(Pro) deacylase [Propionibacteriaceae bacterium]
MAKRKSGGTPALLALDAAKVEYVVHEYGHDARAEVGFGLEGAAALGVDPHLIFKTLLAEVDGKLACAVVPASGMLDLKSFAKAVGGKKAEMADPSVAERATGYVVGGISPLGQKRQHPTVIDASAKEKETILVSGGRRGLSVELAPTELAKLLRASFAPIGR